MDLIGKNILVYGLGITGQSALKALSDKATGLFAYADKITPELKESIIKQYKNLVLLEDIEILDLSKIDFIIKSPGIPPSNPLLTKARLLGINIISDIELAYTLLKTSNIIAITGTNGKTTTTMLMHDVLEQWGKNSFVAGNIGLGLLDLVDKVEKEDYIVVELSSFQLENIISFKPSVALILNITPDHIDWHGSFENYKNAKLRLLKNLAQNETLVLNLDDKELQGIQTKANKRFFSTRKVLKNGVFYSQGGLYSSKNGQMIKLLSTSELNLKGIHNYENICAVYSIGLSLDIPLEIITKAIVSFKAVEHRIEPIRTIGGINYINDSKGTNIEATVKAIEAMDSPFVLIAGGYDKGIEDYSELFNHNIELLKAVVLFGATKEKIAKSAKQKSVKTIELVKNLEEALEAATNNSVKGMNILLSPACASWDMYNNYEERGNDFKKLVNRMADKYEKDHQA